MVGIDSSLSKLSLLLKTKFEKVSHVYSITRTSRHGEFALGGYDGMYFGTVVDKKIGISTESYLSNKTVKQIKEFAPNKFIIGIDNYPAYVIVDRMANTVEE